MSAGTPAEVFVVADQRGVGPEMRALVDGLDVEIVAVTKRVAQRLSEAHAEWGFCKSRDVCVGNLCDL